MVIDAEIKRRTVVMLNGLRTGQFATRKDAANILCCNGISPIDVLK